MEPARKAAESAGVRAEESGAEARLHRKVAEEALAEALRSEQEVGLLQTLMAQQQEAIEIADAIALEQAAVDEAQKRADELLREIASKVRFLLTLSRAPGFS